MAITEIKDISVKEKLDRSKPPKSGKPKDINFPKFFETKMDNGITVIVIEDSRLPLITTRFVFKNGSCNDYYSGKNKTGLASLTSELLTKGTSSRSATDIAEEVDFIGATISAGCDYDATYVSSFSLKKYFDNIFEITTDVILNPVFEDEEIERLREQRINSLLSMKDEGDYLADKIFKKIVYGDSPYSFPIEGKSESLNLIVKEDIKKHYENVFIPQNLIATFVGDITSDEAMLKMNDKFSGWRAGASSTFNIDSPLISDLTNVFLINKRGAVQSSLKLGHIGTKRDNPDYISLIVMNTLLGGFFTSRINKNLREVNGFTYGARSHFSFNKYAGDFSISTEVKNELTKDTVKEILKELNDMREMFVTKEELQNVKNYISGNFPLQLETPNAIATKVINLKLNNLEDDFYNTYIRKVNELTLEDIRDAAMKYIHPDKLTISIAGNTEEIKGSMEQFGKVEIIEDII